MSWACVQCSRSPWIYRSFSNYYSPSISILSFTSLISTCPWFDPSFHVFKESPPDNHFCSLRGSWVRWCKGKPFVFSPSGSPQTDKKHSSLGTRYPLVSSERGTPSGNTGCWFLACCHTKEARLGKGKEIHSCRCSTVLQGPFSRSSICSISVNPSRPSEVLTKLLLTVSAGLFQWT